MGQWFEAKGVRRKQKECFKKLFEGQRSGHGG